jgi:hypothetical protein
MVLAHPVAEAQLTLAVDVSDLHVGAVLQQRAGGRCHMEAPVFVFFQRSWSQCKQDTLPSTESCMPISPPYAISGWQHFRPVDLLQQT